MKLSDYLESLGDTPEAVANSLRAQGIKGKKDSTCHCPILNGIYKACPDYWSGLKIVNGRKEGVHYYYGATLDDAQICDPRLPQPVMDFIGAFDTTNQFDDLAVKSVREVTTRVYE
jgi:hypothetical protein